VAKMLSAHVSNDLTLVCVAAEDGSQQSAIFIHALKGPTLSCPLMPLADQHFLAHFKPYKLSTNTKPYKQQKMSSTSPNSSTKTTNN
jgi:hypothetical protein